MIRWETIEELQQAKDKLQNDYQEAVDKITDLQQRIDKAIEYIKNKPLYTETYDYNEEDNLELKYTDDEIARNDLLEILGVRNE